MNYSQQCFNAQTFYSSVMSAAPSLNEENISLKINKKEKKIKNINLKSEINKRYIDNKIQKENNNKKKLFPYI